jgi:hypothetical protein
METSREEMDGSWFRDLLHLADVWLKIVPGLAYLFLAQLQMTLQLHSITT